MKKIFCDLCSVEVKALPVATLLLKTVGTKHELELCKDCVVKVFEDYYK